MGALRRLIREFGMDDTMRHQAGIFAPGGVSSNVTDREAILNPPPGLGGPQDDEPDDDELQLKGQAGARALDRRPPT